MISKLLCALTVGGFAKLFNRKKNSYIDAKSLSTYLRRDIRRYKEIWFKIIFGMFIAAKIIFSKKFYQSIAFIYCKIS